MPHHLRFQTDHEFYNYARSILMQIFPNFTNGLTENSGRLILGCCMYVASSIVGRAFTELRAGVIANNASSYVCPDIWWNHFFDERLKPTSLDPRGPVNSRTLRSTIAAAMSEVTVTRVVRSGDLYCKWQTPCAIKDLATQDCYLCTTTANRSGILCRFINKHFIYYQSPYTHVHA